MKKAKNFFMVSNNIFSLELKPRDFIVVCYGTATTKRKAVFPLAE